MSNIKKNHVPLAQDSSVLQLVACAGITWFLFCVALWELELRRFAQEMLILLIAVNDKILCLCPSFVSSASIHESLVD